MDVHSYIPSSLLRSDSSFLQSYFDVHILTMNQSFGCRISKSLYSVRQDGAPATSWIALYVYIGWWFGLAVRKFQVCQLESSLHDHICDMRTTCTITHPHRSCRVMSRHHVTPRSAVQSFFSLLARKLSSPLTLKMEARRSSEMSVNYLSIRHRIPVLFSSFFPQSYLHFPWSSNNG
jgi:hypothetical protein